jgi:hypothetical protein
VIYQSIYPKEILEKDGNLKSRSGSLEIVRKFIKKLKNIIDNLIYNNFLTLLWNFVLDKIKNN